MKKGDTFLSVLKKMLRPKRFDHSVSVARTAFSLAEKYGYDTSRAELAGLLHDYARDMSENDLLTVAENKGLISHPVERQVPVLLHGPVGAVLVKEDLGIIDNEILQAIACHTTGAPGMSLLAEIIYLADMIEPLRDYPGVDDLRSLAGSNLQAAVMAGLEASISYCIEAGKLIHPKSIEARNDILMKAAI